LPHDAASEPVQGLYEMPSAPVNRYKRVFRGPAEVWGVPVLDEAAYEGEVYGLVDLAQEVVLRDDPVIEVASVERFLGRARLEHVIPPCDDGYILRENS